MDPHMDPQMDPYMDPQMDPQMDPLKYKEKILKKNSYFLHSLRFGTQIFTFSLLFIHYFTFYTAI